LILVAVASLYVLLALAVHLGMLDAVDTAARNAFRPGSVWGPLQMRAQFVVEGLAPAHLVAPLVLVAATLSLVRRTLRTFAAMAFVAGPVIFVTLVTKLALARPDPYPTSFEHGESFPSGHAVSVVVAFGLAVLFIRPGTRWGWVLPAFMGALMGWALLVVGMHWATDVLGAGLLAVAALGSARAAGLAHWGGRPRNTKDAAEPAES
jgi:undecaprenyl-diphosphatase